MNAEKIGEIDLSDDFGGHKIVFFKIPMDEVHEVPMNFQGYSCQHSYDCCGNWYPSTGKVIEVDEIYQFAIVKQHFIQNV